MVNVDWSIVGVILTAIGIIITVLFGYWQIRKKKKKNEPIPSMIQRVKQEVHIHHSKSEDEKKQRAAKNGEKVHVVWETIFNEMILVPSGREKALEFHLNKYDKIRVFVSEVDKFEFNFYIMDEEEYSEYLSGGRFDPIYEEIDIRSTTIKKTIPREDDWYFVFDAYGKQYDREINVKLRKKLKR